MGWSRLVPTWFCRECRPDTHRCVEGRNSRERGVHGKQVQCAATLGWLSGFIGSQVDVIAALHWKATGVISSLRGRLAHGNAMVSACARARKWMIGSAHFLMEDHVEARWLRRGGPVSETGSTRQVCEVVCRVDTVVLEYQLQQRSLQRSIDIHLSGAPLDAHVTRTDTTPGCLG